MSTAIFALTIALLLTGASALRAEQPALQMSGFATVGMVAINHSDMRFNRVGLDKPGAETPDFGPDTVIGIHANLLLSPNTSAVVQLLSRENPRGNYTPQASLAFLSHSLTPALTVRAGRLRIPFFMLSDSLDINYANPWIRPPVEVYGLNPFSDLDGIDFLFRTRVGAADLEVHPYFGSSYIPIHRRGSGRLDRLAGINFTLTTERLMLFIGHGESTLALKWNDPDFLRLSAVMPAEITRELSGEDGYAAFSAAGFQWDDGDWLVIGEYARRVNKRYSNSAHGWHFTVGRRFDNVMPYLMLARHTEDKAASHAAFPATLLGSLQTTALEGFNVSRNSAQRSITVGTRWDFRRDAALKVELSHMQTTNNSWGSFFPRGEPATTDLRKRSVNMLGVALDVTF